jgi:hypothetical protein
MTSVTDPTVEVGCKKEKNIDWRKSLSEKIKYSRYSTLTFVVKIKPLLYYYVCMYVFPL